MLNKAYWDLETQAAPLAQLNAIMPQFEAAKNIKDDAKVAASIEEKKQAWIDDAALKATTGRVLAYTIAWNDQEPVVMHIDDETTEYDIIKAACADFGKIISESGTAYGFNSHGFDVPFLCQRACVVGIPIIRSYLTSRFRGRVYPHDSQIDIMREWLCGNPDYKGQGLDAVAKALGLAGKTGSGKDFAKLLETDREAALNYAKQDVELVRSIAKKMNI